ncbi:MAG: hypothetical protein R2991_10785 [Thermoanaerobaculia bacterium]
MKRTVLALILLAAVASSASAVLTFTQLDSQTFNVSHRVKLIGSRGQAMKVLYVKTASLCVAAGFTHYQILQQESEAAQEDDSANASARVQFHFGAGPGRIECQPTADPEYVADAREKLAHMGYQAPDPEATAAAMAGQSSSCTLEQIAAMARAGLTDEQIQAACP